MLFDLRIGIIGSVDDGHFVTTPCGRNDVDLAIGSKGTIGKVGGRNRNKPIVLSYDLQGSLNVGGPQIEAVDIEAGGDIDIAGVGRKGYSSLTSQFGQVNPLIIAQGTGAAFEVEEFDVVERIIQDMPAEISPIRRETTFSNTRFSMIGITRVNFL
jgi:hypothetical protein